MRYEIYEGYGKVERGYAWCVHVSGDYCLQNIMFMKDRDWECGIFQKRCPWIAITAAPGVYGVNNSL
jgi:hypothetical protein